jgi:hypothetical protein
MAIHLAVVKPFLTYRKGDVISDQDQIQGILASEHKAYVTKFNPAPGTEA